MILELRDLSYESRLFQCGLTTLQTRRLRGDQIKVFKIVNDYEDVDMIMFFKLKEGSRTRGHKAELVKEQCRLDMRKYSFTHRLEHFWTLNKPMASLATCHLEIVVWDGNLVKSC